MSEDLSRTTSADVSVADPVAQTEATNAKPDRYAKKAVMGSAIGYAMDGFDLLILGFALAAITASLGLNPTQAASLATITLWGAVVGGLVFGVLSDYLGRVRVLTWSIVVFAVFTGLTALSQNYAELAVFRFIAGIGLGAEFGIGMTLAAEAWPARLRARATSLVGLGWQSGVLVAAFVAPAVIAEWGWRALFAIGVIPAIAAVVFRRTLTEPEKFLEGNARRHRKRFPLRLLFADARTTRASIGILVLTSVQNFGYYGIMIWLPSYLAKQFGFTLTKSGLWTAVTVLGMALGIYVFGVLADTLGRRRSFWLFQAGAVVSVLVYSQLSSSVALLIGGAIMGVFVNGMLGGYGALMAELYPTAARATAQNVLFNIGRGVGGLGPIWIAWVATHHGFSYAIALLACIYLLDMVAMAFIPERGGAELPA
jgi:MFS family permease